VASDKALIRFSHAVSKTRQNHITNEGSRRSTPFTSISTTNSQRASARHAILSRAVSPGVPAKGWTNQWEANGTPYVLQSNLDGADNYVWLEATGHGTFCGVTMSVLQNQDGWWGEGDDMFFIDGERLLPSMARAQKTTFWERGFWRTLVFLRAVRSSHGGWEVAGRGSSAYRFHLDSPIRLPSR